MIIRGPIKNMNPICSASSTNKFIIAPSSLVTLGVVVVDLRSFVYIKAFTSFVMRSDNMVELKSKWFVRRVRMNLDKMRITAAVGRDMNVDDVEGDMKWLMRMRLMYIWK